MKENNNLFSCFRSNNSISLSKRIYMNKNQALRDVFKQSPLGDYLRINKHRFLKGTLSDETATNILKTAGYKRVEQEIWERVKKLEKSKFKRSTT